jgi:hypothetical protein
MKQMENQFQVEIQRTAAIRKQIRIDLEDHHESKPSTQQHMLHMQLNAEYETVLKEKKARRLVKKWVQRWLFTKRLKQLTADGGIAKLKKREQTKSDTILELQRNAKVHIQRAKNLLECYLQPLEPFFEGWNRTEVSRVCSTTVLSCVV